MPRKKKSAPIFGKFEPLSISLEFLPNAIDPDSLLILFESYDDRVDTVGQFICDAIAEKLKMIADPAVEFIT